MAAECALCAHADRADLDALLLAGRTGVVSDVARRSGLSRTSVRRHRDAGHHRPSQGAGVDAAISPGVPPWSPPPADVDADLLDFVAELGREDIPRLPTRQRPGARRLAGDLTREATRRRVDALVVLVEGFLEKASDEAYDDDLSGRARLVTACKGALELLGRILGVIGGGEELTRALAQIEAMYECLMAPEHRAAAEAVRDRLRALEERRR